ncbi:MAG: SusC/RagA family TonB-linked outer membrane protein [Paludibacteraceae bacterium]
MKKRKNLNHLKGILIVLMCTITLSGFAQIKTVTGTVVDNLNEPLIGVTVKVQGTSNGTVTNFNGVYSLNNVPTDAKLEFSYVGMKSQTVSTSGQTVINITMTEDAEQLEEVVVVGYGTQKKVNVTGAVSTVSSKDLESRPVQNVSQALQGVVPGLNLSQTNAGGALNSSMSVNIRGTGSIGDGSSATPLVLIDGVEGNMNALNPNDIESISVLKDAASSSIYGARASFGVILITTKSGKSGKTKVSYGGNLRYSNAVQIPEMLDAYRFAQYFNQAAINDGQGAIFSDKSLQNILDYQAYHNGTFTGTLTDDNRNQIMYGTTADSNNRWLLYGGANGNTNWFKEMYMDWAPAQEHNVNVSGGTDKYTFLVSGNLLDQRGLIRHGVDKFNRYSLNGKMTIKMAPWATLDYNNRWIRETYSRPSYMTGLFFHNIARRWPTNPVYDPNGHYLEGNEILQMEGGGLDKDEKDYVYQQLKLTLQPVADWFIRMEGSYNTVTDYDHWDVLPIYGYDANNQPFAAPWQGGDAGQSSVGESSYKNNFWSVNLYTDYAKSINDHNFKVMAGTNIELMKTRNLGGSKKDLITPLIPTINTATNSTPSLYGGYDQWATVGFFGRLNYNYKEKYLFEANLRHDGSSRFINDKTWGTFPSFSAGWNIANEDFFKNLTTSVSTLKLRASWGQLGNMNTSAWHPWFLSMPISTGTGSWLVGGVKPNTSSAPGIVSSLLTWETVQSANVGLDWNALNGRFTGSVEVFNRKTLNMIGQAVELSSILGTSVPKLNNADMESRGWELELNWRDKISDFSYGLKFVLSDDKQKILRFPNATKSLSNWYEGEVIGDIWGYTTVGIAKSNQEMVDHLANNKPSWGSDWAAGDIMYKDLNNDKLVNGGKNTLDDHGDLSVIGNSNPRFKYGFTFDAAFKGFDFRAFLQGVAKRDYVLGGPYFWGATGGQWQSAAFVQHWDFFRPEGDPLGANLDAYYPRPQFSKSGKNQYTQTRYLQNAAYMRLKNIQLGYTLPESIVKYAAMQSARIYVSADNLLTVSKITGIFDPELLGGDWGQGKLYPLSRTISFGVNLNF